MRYCTRRGNTNPARVASSKLSLFWMIVAIAAASSVLSGRATFATALGRFAGTLFAAVFLSFGITCMILSER